MARCSLVVDASVVVKWFSAVGEADVQQAVSLLEQYVEGEMLLVVPDLLYYEVANALVHKKELSTERVQSCLDNLFALSMQTIAISDELMLSSIRLAREFPITMYDACYPALAQIHNYPLVTANPRHQSYPLGCEVIPIKQWRKR